MSRSDKGRWFIASHTHDIILCNYDSFVDLLADIYRDKEKAKKMRKFFHPATAEERERYDLDNGER